VTDIVRAARTVGELRESIAQIADDARVILVAEYRDDAGDLDVVTGRLESAIKRDNGILVLRTW